MRVYDQWWLTTFIWYQSNASCESEITDYHTAVSGYLVMLPVRLSTVDGRAFAVAAPHMWNGLTGDVILASSLFTFQRDCLNVFFLFQQYFTRPPLKQVENPKSTAGRWIPVLYKNCESCSIPDTYSMVLTCFFIFREILLDFNQFLAIMSTLATFI